MAVVQHPAVGAPARPRVSVCIANYNGVGLLADCVASVQSQDCDVAIEIIVHDDASNDGSVAMIRERWPQVHLLESDENVGFCISNNRMVDIARGDYVLLLNNDAALYPDAIRQLLVEAKRLARPAILTLPQYDWETGALVDRGCLLDPFYNPVPNLDPTRTHVAYVIGACLWIPKALWDDLGGFPDWFGSIAEDMYLCCMARLRGVQVLVTPASGYRHRQGSSFGGNRLAGPRPRTTLRRRRLSERNKTRVLFVTTPTPLMWPWLGAHLLLLGMEGLVVAAWSGNRRVFGDVYANTAKCLARDFRRLRHARTQVQAQRVVSLGSYLRAFAWRLRKLTLARRHGMPELKEEDRSG